MMLVIITARGDQMIKSTGNVTRLMYNKRINKIKLLFDVMETPMSFYICEEIKYHEHSGTIFPHVIITIILLIH